MSSPRGDEDTSLKTKEKGAKMPNVHVAGSETGFPAGEGKEREKWKGFWIN